jgi:hypothetical protein
MPTFRYGYTLQFPGDGSPGRSIWHFRSEDEVGSASPQDVVDIIDDWWTAVWATNVVAPPCRVDGDSEAINVATQEITPITPAFANNPAAAVEFNPSGMLVCTMRTSSATKSGLGRKFIGPVRSSVTNVDGRPDAANVTSVQAACTALVSASVGLTGAAVGVYSPTEGLFRDLTVMTCRNYMAVLRSRRD